MSITGNLKTMELAELLQEVRVALRELHEAVEGAWLWRSGDPRRDERAGFGAAETTQRELPCPRMATSRGGQIGQRLAAGDQQREREVGQTPGEELQE